MTWEAIEAALKKDKEQVQKVVSYLMDGGIAFRHSSSKQEGFLHPCSDSEYCYQFTYFDRLGPVGDFRRNTIEEIAKSIQEYQFEPCSIEQFQFIS